MATLTSLFLLFLLITFLGSVSYAVARLAFVESSRATGCLCLALLWLFPFLFSFFVPGSILIVVVLAWLSYGALNIFHSQVRRTQKEKSLIVSLIVGLPACVLSGSLYYLATSEGRLKVYRDEPAAMCAGVLCPLLIALLHWVWMRNRSRLSETSIESAH